MQKIFKNKLSLLSYALVCIVVFYRRPDAFYHSQFWAEEGIVFYKDAFENGFSSLFYTCAGYYHLFPRLLACLAVSLQLPFHVITILFCYAWLFILFLLVFYIWKRLPFQSFQKFAIVLVIVLLPLQSEVFMNQTNMQWIMALFPIIIFSSLNNNSTTHWLWLDIIVLIITGFTGPNFTVLLPLFLFLVWFQKSIWRKQKPVLFLYAIAIAIGLIGGLALMNHGSVSRTNATSFILLNEGFIKYVFAQYWFMFIGKFVFKMPLIIMIIGCLLTGIFFGWVLKQLFQKQIPHFVVISFIVGLLFLGSTIIAYRYEPELLSPYYRGVRNFYIPGLTFVWIIIYFISLLPKAKIVLSLLMVLFSLELLVFVGSQTFTNFTPNNYSYKINHTDSISIPINPEGWYIQLNSKNK